MKWIVLGVFLALAVTFYFPFILSGTLAREEEAAERVQQEGVDRYA